MFSRIATMPFPSKKTLCCLIAASLPLFCSSHAFADNLIIAGGESKTISLGEIYDTTGNSLIIGNSSTTSGSLTIGTGGTVRSNQVVIGNNGSLGTVTVDGGAWNITGSSNLTTSNRANLLIENGGTVKSSTDLWFGYTNSPSNQDEAASVTVDGTGSSLTTTASLYIGNSYSANFTVSDGATVSANQIVVSRLVGSNSSLTITGTGSVVAATSTFSVAQAYQNTDASKTTVGTVTIADGGKLVTNIAGTNTVMLAGWLDPNQKSGIGATAVVNLNGTKGSRGTWETTHIAGGPGSASLIFDGGVLKALSDNADFISGFGTDDRVAVKSGGAFIDTNGHDIGISVGIEDYSDDNGGGISKSGAGTLTLAGTNTYTGDTAISAGTLTIGGTGSLDSGNYAGDIAIATDAVFDYSSTTDQILSGQISGDGSFVKGEDSTLTLTGSNTYTGSTTISGGTLAVSGSGSLGSGDYAGDISIAKDATLKYASSADQILSSSLTGSGSMVKEGKSTLAFNGDGSAFAGTTTVSSGTLTVGDADNTSAVLGGDVTASSGSTLGGYGTVGGDVVVSGTLTPGETGKAGTFSIGGDLTLNTGSSVNYDFGVDDASSDLIDVGGSVSVESSTINISGYSADGTTPETRVAIDAAKGITGAGNITLTVAGQSLNDVDFLQGVTGSLNSSATEYSITIKGLSWYGEAIDSNTKKTLAHGNFTVVGDTPFTLGSILADREAGSYADGSGNDWDGNSLTKKGNGTLILTAENTYSGTTTILDGTLQIGDIDHQDASIGDGAVSVGSGAALSGYGTVGGDVTVSSGAMLSPGTSDAVGTLTVGSVTFDTGSVYAVNVEADGSGDLLKVSDTATVNGGTVVVTAGAGNWSSNASYLIIDTANGVNGTFDNLSSDFAFLTAALSYTGSQVWLDLTRNETSFEDVADTYNQHSTATAISSLSADNAVVKAIASMNAAQARAAYDNLSGEIYGSTRSALLTNSRYLRDAVNTRLLAESQMPSDKAGWISTWGHNSRTDSDGNAASATNKGWGFAIGADGNITDDLLIGGVAGYEKTKVKSRARASTSDVDAYHLVAYAATTFKGIDVRGGLAYSYLSADTDRSININTLAGTQSSEYHGWQVQAFAEGSKKFLLTDHVSFSPYLNLAHVWLNLDSAKEQGTAAALNVQSGTDNATFTTLGVRGEWELSSAVPVRLYGDLGWQYAFGDVNGNTFNRFASGGNLFNVRGAAVDKNSALVGLGIKAATGKKGTLSLGYRGQFGSDTSDNALTAEWKLRF